MASNFQIMTCRKRERIHTKPICDFDESAAVIQHILVHGSRTLEILCSRVKMRQR